jgi:hypothetical protein
MRTRLLSVSETQRFPDPSRARPMGLFVEVAEGGSELRAEVKFACPKTYSAAAPFARVSLSGYRRTRLLPVSATKTFPEVGSMMTADISPRFEAVGVIAALPLVKLVCPSTRSAAGKFTTCLGVCLDAGRDGEGEEENGFSHGGGGPGVLFYNGREGGRRRKKDPAIKKTDNV